MRRITIWLAKPPGPDPSAQSVSGSQQGAVGATDRYSFHLTVTQTVELELRAQDADADLILLNDQDAAISESRNDGTANEAITKRLPAGSYAVAVQAQQAIANRFKLTYEAILNSEPHELGDLTEGQWDPLTGPVTDNNVGSASNRLDNYTFTLSEPKTLHLLVTGQEGDTDLYLEDEDGAHIAQSQNSGTTDEAITTTLTAGTWYLAIKPKTTGTNFAYSLRYGVTNPTTPESLLLIALANRASRGIWSNATTMWVADSADDKIYAYDLATGGRDPAQDIDTLDAGNTRQLQQQVGPDGHLVKWHGHVGCRPGRFQDQDLCLQTRQRGPRRGQRHSTDSTLRATAIPGTFGQTVPPFGSPTATTTWSMPTTSSTAPATLPET